MTPYTSRVETYTNFGEDIKRNCEHLIKLAEQVDSVLNTYSTDVQDIDAQNQAHQMYLALNHEVKELATILNSINDENGRLDRLANTLRQREGQ